MADYPSYGGGGVAGPDGSRMDDWWNDALPFFLGASGVLGMDAAVGVQWLMWGEREPEVEEEEVGGVNERTSLLA